MGLTKDINKQLTNKHKHQQTLNKKPHEQSRQNSEKILLYQKERRVDII